MFDKGVIKASDIGNDTKEALHARAASKLLRDSSLGLTFSTISLNPTLKIKIYSVTKDYDFFSLLKNSIP